MNAAAMCVPVLMLAATPGFPGGPPQTTMQLRVAPECAVIGVRHTSVHSEPGLRSGVTNFRLLLRTSKEGSASLISDFRPVGAVNASVTYVVSIAQAGTRVRQVTSEPGSITELASFPSNARSSREGLAGEVAWTYAVEPNLPDVPGVEPSLTVACR